MAKKKTKVKVDLQRRDFLLIAGAAIGSALAAPLLTTGSLSPFSQIKQQQLSGDLYEGGQGGCLWWSRSR